MSRTTISVTDDAHDRLAAHKGDGESWTDVFERAAAALDGDGDGEDRDPQTDPCVVSAETIEEIARATAAEVEDRMTRR